MKRILTLTFIALILLLSFSGCPPPVKDGPKPMIDLTGIIYPGSAPFEGAKYDYLTSDPPEKVADWFKQTLPEATVEQKTSSAPSDSKWIVTYKNYIIDIVVGPGGTESLIRYKYNLEKK